jgi:tryptophan-associated transmembrane protein
VDEPRLDASRPSNLRLAGFAFTAVGALLLGVASRLTWVTLGSSALPPETSYLGTELGAGKIALAAAIMLLVLIVVVRTVEGRWRTILSIVMILIAAVAAAFAAWFALSAADHYSPTNNDAMINALAAALHRTPDQIRADMTTLIDQAGGYTHLGPGVWVAIVGGVVAIVGSVLTLRWAGRMGAPAGVDEPTASDADPRSETPVWEN